jgi:hypothetical protein
MKTEMSAEIGEMTKALIIVQQYLQPVKKNAKAQYTYADIGAISESCRDALHENGFAVIQTGAAEGNEGGALVTTLLHESGQWIRGAFPLVFDKPTSQAQGSAITYLRRYSLAALLGILTEDDDGQRASESNGSTHASTPAAGHPSGAPSGGGGGGSSSTISEAQVKRMYAKTKAAHLDKDSLKSYVLANTGKDSLLDVLKGAEYDAICEWLDNYTAEHEGDDLDPATDVQREEMDRAAEEVGWEVYSSILETAKVQSDLDALTSGQAKWIIKKMNDTPRP